VSEVLLAGDLTARDPGDDALLTAFAGGLPGRRLALLSAGRNGQAERRGHPVIALSDWRGLLSALRRCRVLVLGDGALHGSTDPMRGHRARQALRISLAAKALGRRVALLGVGAGTLDRSADRARVSTLVRMADLLVLRDSETAEVLAAAGAPGPFRVAADPAWCALEPLHEAAGDRHGLLAILDADAMPAGGTGPVRLAIALDLLAASGLRIQLAPWRVNRHGGDDLDLARAVAARMGAQARVLLPPSGFEEARAAAGRARVVLGLRFHALIAAAGAGTPAVALSDDPETVRLAERLGQHGLGAESAPEAIARAALAAAGRPSASAEAIRAERSAAQQAFRLLRLLLDAEHSEEDHELAALPLVPAPATGAENTVGSVSR
jgi:polysaccharide pyruvyl transferase WcaK-like protein